MAYSSIGCRAQSKWLHPHLQHSTNARQNAQPSTTSHMTNTQPQMSVMHKCAIFVTLARSQAAYRLLSFDCLSNTCKASVCCSTSPLTPSCICCSSCSWSCSFCSSCLLCDSKSGMPASSCSASVLLAYKAGQNTVSAYRCKMVGMHTTGCGYIGCAHCHNSCMVRTHT